MKITITQHLERCRHVLPANEGNLTVSNDSNIIIEQHLQKRSTTVSKETYYSVIIDQHLERFRHVVPANDSKQLIQDQTPFKLNPTRQQTHTHTYIHKFTHTRMCCARERANKKVG